MTSADLVPGTAQQATGYFDIAVRDFGLFVGAVALARLATCYAPGSRTS